jgi:hypothetical protein
MMVFAMAAVLGVLVIGIFGMAKGGSFNQKYGNRLMQARVYLQAAALGLFVLAILTRTQGG